MTVAAKICGLRSEPALRAALAGGARWCGFVFYPPSPRALSPAEAGALRARLPDHIVPVGLFVDAEDAAIDAAVETAGIAMLQLHGGESPDRVADLRRRHGLPVMKALKIARAEDVAAAAAYDGIADRLLFDAKPPPERADALPGGNGLAFDWRLLAGRAWRSEWMLSGGLDAGNVAAAVAATGAPAVDVSSSVESAPGVKDPAAIKAFLDAVAAL